MRFTALATTLLAATAASVSAMPVKRASAGDVQTVGKGVCFLEAGLGVTGLTELLDTSLGGLVTSLEDALGVTALESGLGLTSCEDETSGLSDLELIGKALCYIEKGLGVTDVTEFVDELVGGAVTDLEEKLGVTDLEEALKITDC